MDDELLRTGGEFEQIVARYKSAVYGLALVKTGSPVDADDVFQEVFLAYYQSKKNFREEEHRKAWLLRTTLNMSRRVTASSWRKKTVPLEEQTQQTVAFREPEENRVWQALCALPEEYRLPLYLFYFQELPTKEIARALSLRDGTVRTRLSRGREMLRETLKGEYFDDE